MLRDRQDAKSHVIRILIIISINIDYNIFINLNINIIITLDIDNKVFLLLVLFSLIFSELKIYLILNLK